MADWEAAIFEAIPYREVNRLQSGGKFWVVFIFLITQSNSKNIIFVYL